MKYYKYHYRIFAEFLEKSLNLKYILPKKSWDTFFVKKKLNKLGLSCAKLRPALASYQLAFVWLAFTEAAY